MMPASLAFLCALAVHMAAASPASATAMFMGIGMLPDRNESMAVDISADGSAVVGRSQGGAGSSASPQAFLWTESEGMQGLGFLPGDESSEAHAVSADGSVVVGVSEFSSWVFEAFRWTLDDGMVGLGVHPRPDPSRRGVMQLRISSSVKRLYGLHVERRSARLESTPRRCGIRTHFACRGARQRSTIPVRLGTPSPSTPG